MNPKPCKREGCQKKRYGNSSLCREHHFSHEREKKLKALERKKNSKKAVEKREKTIANRLDKLWSRIIRSQGYCDLCGLPTEFRKANAHHLIPRRKKFTRWDLNNGSNLHGMVCHKEGIHRDTTQAERLMKNLTERRGQDWHDLLMSKREVIWKPTEPELEEIERDLEERLSKLD